MTCRCCSAVPSRSSETGAVYSTPSDTVINQLSVLLLLVVVVVVVIFVVAVVVVAYILPLLW